MSEVTAYERDEVGNSKTMETSAKLYRNGLLLIETTSRSSHWSEGLRGRVFVICVDDQGRSIYVSQEYQCSTCGSIFDFTTPSKRKDNFTENLPEVVGRYTQSLDIVHSSGPLGDSRAQLIAAIKTMTGIYEELKSVIKDLK